MAWRPQTSHSVAGPFRIQLFGNLRITAGGAPLNLVNKARLQALLAYLILENETPQLRERIAFLLWPESGEAQARTNLRQLLHHLRNAVPPECGLLNGDHNTVQWLPGPACSVDVVEFDRAVASAREASRSDTAPEFESLKKAAELYEDDLLPGLYDDWLRARREKYRVEAARVFNGLARILEQKRDYAGAIKYAERLVALDELRETHYQLLIRLHQLNLDRASALRAYHQCMRTLRRELGVTPSAATRALFEDALKADAVVMSTATSSGSAADSPAPIVGRKSEWERLVRCWKAAAGESQLAVITGEPGIGKSRLAEELYLRSKDAAAVAKARCYAAQGRLAYAPVTEWLRSAPLRAAWSQLPESQLAELARMLPEILAGNRTIARPVALAEGWQRRHLYDALNAAFARAAKPLLLVIDDLQWCDQDSLEWLQSFFETDMEGGVLVAATVRAEEMDRSHPFTKVVERLRQSGQVSDIPLLPLGQDETAALGRQIAGRALDQAELDRLWAVTRGNPLFVVETVRVGLDGATPPPRVRAVIVSRFAQLSASAYELVGFAGAIGRAFSFDLLAAATDWNEETLARDLDELWRRRVIEPKGAGQYDFTHDLLREVAYAELSPVRKRFFHRRIARALEEIHRSELEYVAGQVAAHYGAADMADEAIRYYRMAADAARLRYADREAAANLRRAIALCAEMPETAARKRQVLELLIALQRTLVTTLGYAATEVGETSARALALFRELKATDLAIPVLSGAWGFHAVRGEFGAGESIGKELLEIADADGRAITSVTASFVLGSVYFHQARFEPAREQLEKTLAALAGCPRDDLALFATPELGLFCSSYLTHVLWHIGCPDLALERSEETVALADEAHPFGTAIALIYAALLHVFRREADEALGHAERAAALCTRYEIAYYAAVAGIIAGWCRAELGDAERGLAEIRNGLNGMRATGAEIRLPLYHALLAEVWLRAGKPGEALANVSNGFAFQNKNGETWTLPFLHLIEGDVFFEGGDRAQAASSYRRALEAAHNTGAQSLEIRAASRLCRADPFAALNWREGAGLAANQP